ncbi:MAG: TetR/AcrR family transcriptional regulator [Syntrophobacteraceae bacterium]
MRVKTADKRLRILDSAVKVFAREGFFKARVSQIAEEAGLAPGTVYLYFKNKEDLLISVFEVRTEEFVSRFRAAVEQKQDACSRLECLVRMHLSGFQADPDLAACFQVELRQSSRFMRRGVKGGLQLYLGLIREIVEFGRKEGAFRREVSAGLITHLIFGTLDEVVSTWVMSGMKYNLVSLTDQLVELITNGIGPKVSVLCERGLGAEGGPGKTLN